jgi:hypothetical protein
LKKPDAKGLGSWFAKKPKKPREQEAQEQKPNEQEAQKQDTGEQETPKQEPIEQEPQKTDAAPEAKKQEAQEQEAQIQDIKETETQQKAQPKPKAKGLSSWFAKKPKKQEAEPQKQTAEQGVPAQSIEEQEPQKQEIREPEIQQEVKQKPNGKGLGSLFSKKPKKPKSQKAPDQAPKGPVAQEQSAQVQEPQKLEVKAQAAVQPPQQKPKVKGLGSWFSAKQKSMSEKEAAQRKLEWPQLRLLTLLVTLVTMTVGMSFLPLFPQPLPIILAVLVALLTYKNPAFGMPVGGAILGLGLMAHLAELGFIAYLGPPVARMVFVGLVIGLLTICPVFFRRHTAALAIDFGILAVICLLFNQTYFLAIPLILTSAVFLKKYAAFTVLYYTLLSTPLLVVQYYSYIVTITAEHWWQNPGASPPILSPLSSIFRTINWGLNQFRLFDTSRVIYNIQNQITAAPDLTGRSFKDAIIQYLSSIPGILLFLVLVAGLALALIYVTRNMVKKSKLNYADRLFSSLAATFATFMFFLLLILLQGPLGFTANVTPLTMGMATGATLLFTLPAAFGDLTAKRRVTPQEMLDKEKALGIRLKVFEEMLTSIHQNIPVDISPPEARTKVVQDALDDILQKQKNQYYEVFNIDELLDEPEKLNKQLDEVETQLYGILSQYHIYNGCELSSWKGRLRESGLKADHLVNVEFRRELPLELRIEAIKQILNSGRTLAKDMVNEVESTHTLVRNCYAPTMPEKNRAVEFTEEKMVGLDVPWIAVDALFSSLNNYNRQFGLSLLRDMKNLNSALTPIANLGSKKDLLPLVFGEHLPRVLGYVNEAQAIQASLAKHTFGEYLSLMDLIILKNNIRSLLAMSTDVLNVLYTRMQSEEEAISNLVPTENYLWAKNATLSERLRKATENLANTAEYKDNQVLKNLTEYIGYVDEAVETMHGYVEQKEFLLNYPLAETAIEEQLKQKKQITPQDLPFKEKWAGEYLRIYYSQRFNKYAFDRENQVLTRRPQA